MPDAPTTKFQAVLQELGISRVICIDDIYDSRIDIESILAWTVPAKNHQLLKSILTKAGHDIDTTSGIVQATVRTILEESAEIAINLQATICRQQIKSEQENTVQWCLEATSRTAISAILVAAQINIDWTANKAKDELKKLLYGVEEPELTSVRDSIHRIRREALGESGLSDQDIQLFTDRSVLHRLDELMEGFPNFQGLSPSQWIAQRQAILGSLNTEKTLFIFDESLGQGVQSGTEQILEISGTPEGSNAYFGLLSYNIIPGTEHERTREFQRKNVVATAIPKRELSNSTGIEELQLRLRAAVLWKESKELRQTCQDALQTASVKAYERVNALTTLEFDEVVFQSSYKEGVHEMDTLVRIYTNAFAASLREMLRTNASALRDIDKLRNFRGAVAEPATRGSSAWKLQRDEYYESGSYINSCKMPPEAGDVYKITDEDGRTCEYVLIAPPCDLMVRNTSGDRKKGVNSAILCPINRAKPADNKLREAFQLDYYSEEDGSFAWVIFPEGLTIDLWMLDLCTLDPDGRAVRLLNDAIPEHLSDGWRRKCQDDLIPRCNRLFEAWKAWAALRKSTRDGLGIRPAHRITLGNQLPIKVQVKRSRGHSTLQIGIERMQRLAPILSSELIRTYSDYIARPARPHSLSVDSTIGS